MVGLFILTNGATMTAAEKNKHYGLLNERFDFRSAQLHVIGFRYLKVEGYDLAVFAYVRHGKKMTIAAGTVMNADEIVWADTLHRAEQFVS